MSIKIFHNNQCSKSRCAIQLLDEKSVNYEVVEYLKTPLNKKELTELIQQLGIQPEELIRKNEPIFKEHFAGKTLKKSEWIAAMVKFPKLIERPIVLSNGKAIIGRPVERILDILS